MQALLLASSVQPIRPVSYRLVGDQLVTFHRKQGHESGVGAPAQNRSIGPVTGLSRGPN